MYNWNGKRVIVTGATGFVGSTLARRLSGVGAHVHAMSRQRHDDPLSKIEWHVLNLRDFDAVRRTVRAIDPVIVFHLAARVTGARDIDALIPVLHDNLTATVNLLAAVSENPDASIVLAGSIEEPKSADHQTDPSSPYAMAKWAATRYSRMFHDLYGTPTTVLRVGMVYGPGDTTMTRLVPYVIDSLLKGSRPRLTAGTRLVDWVYVDDVVDAFLRAGVQDRHSGHVFDICSGQPISIRASVERIATMMDDPTAPLFGVLPSRQLDRDQIADPSAALEALHWRPSVALDQGLMQTIEWYSAHLKIV